MLYLSALGGLFICSLILLHTAGRDNFLTEQLCNADGSHGCDKVMLSKAGKFNKHFGWGDVGLVYFAAEALYILLSQITAVPILVLFLLVLGSIGFLLSFLSLYYQWKVVKSWCRMCLLVIAVVWIQEIVILQWADMLSIAPIDRVSVFSNLTGLFSFSFILPAIIWLFIKPIWLKNEESEENKIRLLKWKRNPAIFLSLLQRQRVVDITSWADDIVMGNKDAPVQLMLVCNPYCNPCAKAHKELETLLQMFTQQLDVTIRFIVNVSDKQDKKTIALKYILNACFYNSKQHENSQLKHPVDAWFEQMDIEKFKQEYGFNEDLKDFEELMNKHAGWCEESNIQHTPTVFINGYELTAPYTIYDLKLVLNGIIENIAPLAAVANVVE